jgi:hypothetical protein
MSCNPLQGFLDMNDSNKRQCMGINATGIEATWSAENGTAADAPLSPDILDLDDLDADQLCLGVVSDLH